MKPLMGTRFVLGWVKGVASASVVCAAAKLGGETGGNDWVAGEMGKGVDYSSSEFEIMMDWRWMR